MPFTLHPQLEADSHLVCNLPLSQLRLHKNATLPWLILIPRHDDLSEIHQLSTDDQQQLMQEITGMSSDMAKIFAPDKINIGMLGNIVSQLHIHIVARWLSDPAWPGPVWGHLHYKDYKTHNLFMTLDRIKAGPYIVNQSLKS